MLRFSNLNKHFGELPFFENFYLLLSCDGFMVLKCCIHDFAEEVIEIIIISPSDTSDRLKLKADVQNVLWVGEN